MLRELRRFFASSPSFNAPQVPLERVHLAVTALLVEMARADQVEQPLEFAAITGLVAGHFHLSQSEAETLLAGARAACDQSASLTDFTRTLHQELSPAEKLSVIAMLWDVALKDQQLDKYESFLIDKVAELLYISRSDVLRLRFAAGERQNER